jgi:hypothetical protein
MINAEILSRLIEAKIYFTSTKFQGFVDNAERLFNDGMIDECLIQLDNLPTLDHLSAAIIEKLRDKKHIYRTLLQICRGEKTHEGVKEAIDKTTVAKGLSSLLTHVLIECEHGNLEYRMLIPVIQESLNEAIYNLVKGANK